MRHFLRDDDLSPAELVEVLDLADTLKKDRFAARPLAGPQTVAVLFDKSSTRTRVSFSVGIAELGGYPLVLDAAASQLGRGESIEDTAKVMGRMVDAIMLRTGPHETLLELDRHAGVPVINGLTYEHHPCQALADAQTLRERFGPLGGLRLAYLGDGNNVCVSLMIVAALTGMAFTAACPDGFTPPPEIVDWASRISLEQGGSVRVVSDPLTAVAGARATEPSSCVARSAAGLRTRVRSISTDSRRFATDEPAQ